MLASSSKYVYIIIKREKRNLENIFLRTPNFLPLVCTENIEFFTVFTYVLYILYMANIACQISDGIVLRSLLYLFCNENTSVFSNENKEF